MDVVTQFKGYSAVVIIVVIIRVFVSLFCFAFVSCHKRAIYGRYLSIILLRFNLKEESTNVYAAKKAPYENLLKCNGYYLSS